MIQPEEMLDDLSTQPLADSRTYGISHDHVKHVEPDVQQDLAGDNNLALPTGLEGEPEGQPPHHMPPPNMSGFHKYGENCVYFSKDIYAKFEESVAGLGSKEYSGVQFLYQCRGMGAGQPGRTYGQVNWLAMNGAGEALPVGDERPYQLEMRKGTNYRYKYLDRQSPDSLVTSALPIAINYDPQLYPQSWVDEDIYRLANDIPISKTLNTILHMAFEGVEFRHAELTVTKALSIARGDYLTNFMRMVRNYPTSRKYDGSGYFGHAFSNEILSVLSIEEAVRLTAADPVYATVLDMGIQAAPAALNQARPICSMLNVEGTSWLQKELWDAAMRGLIIVIDGLNLSFTEMRSIVYMVTQKVPGANNTLPRMVLNPRAGEVFNLSFYAPNDRVLRKGYKPPDRAAANTLSAFTQQALNKMGEIVVLAGPELWLEAQNLGALEGLPAGPFVAVVPGPAVAPANLFPQATDAAGVYQAHAAGSDGIYTVCVNDAADHRTALALATAAKAYLPKLGDMGGVLKSLLVSMLDYGAWNYWCAVAPAAGGPVMEEVVRVHGMPGSTTLIRPHAISTLFSILSQRLMMRDKVEAVPAMVTADRGLASGSGASTGSQASSGSAATSVVTNNAATVLPATYRLDETESVVNQISRATLLASRLDLAAAFPEPGTKDPRVMLNCVISDVADYEGLGRHLLSVGPGMLDATLEASFAFAQCMGLVFSECNITRAMIGCIGKDNAQLAAMPVAVRPTLDSRGFLVDLFGLDGPAASKVIVMPAHISMALANLAFFYGAQLPSADSFKYHWGITKNSYVANFGQPQNMGVFYAQDKIFGLVNSASQANVMSFLPVSSGVPTSGMCYEVKEFAMNYAGPGWGLVFDNVLRATIFSGLHRVYKLRSRTSLYAKGAVSERMPDVKANEFMTKDPYFIALIAFFLQTGMIHAGGGGGPTVCLVPGDSTARGPYPVPVADNLLRTLASRAPGGFNPINFPTWMLAGLPPPDTFMMDEYAVVTYDYVTNEYVVPVSKFMANNATPRRELGIKIGADQVVFSPSVQVATGNELAIIDSTVARPGLVTQRVGWMTKRKAEAIESTTSLVAMVVTDGLLRTEVVVPYLTQGTGTMDIVNKPADTVVYRFDNTATAASVEDF